MSTHITPCLFALVGALAVDPGSVRRDAVDQARVQQLSTALRELVLQALPNPLYERAENWGHTAPAPHAVKWDGDGLLRKPKLVYTKRNDGTWRRIHLVAADPERNLVAVLSNVRRADPGKLTFDLFMACDVHATIWQQNWKKGVKLFSGEARARMRVQALLKIESTMVVVPTKGWLPDFVVKLRLVHAQAGYDDLVFEHLPGISGDAAKLLGEAAQGIITAVKPSLERKLLARLEAALLKAGRDRDIKLRLGQVLAK
jgi:hypothetical protein